MVGKTKSLLYNGDRFYKLTIIETKTNPCRLHRCRCDCGRFTGWLEPTALRTGNNKSCGSCRGPEIPPIGTVFGNLTLIKIKGRRLFLRCICGKEVNYPAGVILSGNTQSCGNCGLKRNGKLTSKPALKTHKLISKILQEEGAHNHQLPYIGNVDIFFPKHNIVVEYHGYASHKLLYGDKSEQDNIKKQKIITEKYRVLIIKAGGNKKDIPSEEELTIKLNKLILGSKSQTIIHKSWYEFEKKYNNREARRAANGGGSLDINWTRKEDEYLIKHYMIMPTEELALKLNRTKIGIQSRWSKIRPDDTINRGWVSTDDAIKRANSAVHKKKKKKCVYISGLKLRSDGSADIDSICKFRCSCGNEFDRKIREVFYQHQTLCLICAGRVPFSKKHQQYILDHYMITDIEVLSKKLGHSKGSIQTWWTKNKPKNTKRKASVDEKELIKRISLIEKNGHKPIYLHGYTKMNTKTGCWWQCPVCNNNFERSPNNIISKHNKDVVCPKCTHRLAGIRSAITKRKHNVN